MTRFFSRNWSTGTPEKVTAGAELVRSKIPSDGASDGPFSPKLDRPVTRFQRLRLWSINAKGLITDEGVAVAGVPRLGMPCMSTRRPIRWHGLHHRRQRDSRGGSEDRERVQRIHRAFDRQHQNSNRPERARRPGHPGQYPTGISYSDKDIAALAWVRHDFHGNWNYTLLSSDTP
jgi:hypothetical protein